MLPDPSVLASELALSAERVEVLTAQCAEQDGLIARLSAQLGEQELRLQQSAAVSAEPQGLQVVVDAVAAKDAELQALKDQLAMHTTAFDAYRARVGDEESVLAHTMRRSAPASPCLPLPTSRCGSTQPCTMCGGERSGEEGGTSPTGCQTPLASALPNAQLATIQNTCRDLTSQLETSNAHAENLEQQLQELTALLEQRAAQVQRLEAELEHLRSTSSSSS